MPGVSPGGATRGSYLPRAEVLCDTESCVVGIVVHITVQNGYAYRAPPAQLGGRPASQPTVQAVAQACARREREESVAALPL